MPLTPERLNEIRERLEKATEGPWALATNHLGMLDVVHPTGTVLYTLVNCKPTSEDAAFIAHARQDMSDLLEALEKGRENENH